MENNSGLEPRGVAVLVKPYTPKSKQTKLIEIPEFVQTKLASVDTMMEVVAIGPNAWYEEPNPRAKVGEIVMVTKYAGLVAIGPKDGVTYRLVNDRDIFCAVTSEGEQQ